MQPEQVKYTPARSVCYSSSHSACRNHGLRRTLFAAMLSPLAAGVYGLLGLAGATGLGVGGFAYASRWPTSQLFGRTLIAPRKPGELALTFDDGPNPAWTPRLLDLLAEHNVHATFFVVGKFAKAERELARRIAEAGHVLGKTGTYGDYGASALIGAIRTTDRGTVYFAILNHNVPVPQARHRQDRFVRFLLSQLHSAPWTYQRDPRPAITRAEVAIMLP